MDEHEDDWAPLTPEQLAMRPGEAAEEQPGSTLAAEPKCTPVAPLPERKVHKAPNPRGEAMLRELQARLCRAGPSDSLIAQVQQREQRVARKQQAAHRARPQLSATCVAVSGREVELPPEPPAELQIEKQSDVDVRELEPWFLELPTTEQERLRAAWHAERHRFDHTGKAFRRRMQRAMLFAGMVFVVDGVFMGLFTGFAIFLRFLLAGPLAGGLAQAIGGGRFSFALCGGLGFVAAMGSAMLSSPMVLYGLLLAAFGMAAIGMDGEMRRSAGYQDD